jgi:hypothetical protein
VAVQISVVDRKDRIVRIEEEIKSPISHEVVVFRDRPEQLPVVRLPIGFLLYRMENGRTRVLQEEFTRKNDVDENYFVSGEENEEVQKVQHGFLLQQSKDPRADIHGELSYCALQTENVLITHSGVVLNGNRRLAAMRDLLAGEDGAKFSSFGSVSATVLPSTATIADLEDIESELQERPETKLEYDWISRRLNLRRRRDQMNIPVEKLKKMYRFKSQKDINREVEQLELAEDYLERYLKRSKDYSAVENSEQIFKQLQAALETKSGELEELSRCIAFPLIKEARGLQDRVYQFRFAFGADAEEVIRRLAREQNIQIGGASGSAAQPVEIDPEDPLSGISEEPDQKYSAVKPLLLDEQNSKVRAQQIARITGAIRQEKEEGGRKMIALRNAEAANRYLYDIELNGADPASFPALRAQLTSCIERAREILSKIPETKTDPAKPAV